MFLESVFKIFFSKCENFFGYKKIQKKKSVNLWQINKSFNKKNLIKKNCEI